MVLYDPFKIKVDVGLLLRVFIATSHLIKNPSIPSWKAMTIGRCLFVCLFNRSHPSDAPEDNGGGYASPSDLNRTQE